MENQTSKPLQIGSVIAESFSLFLNNFPLLLAISLIGSSFAVLDVLLKFVAYYVPPSLSFLLGVPGFFVSYWSMMAVTYAASEKYQNNPITVKQAFIKGAEGRYLRYLGVSVSLMLLMGVGFLLLIVPGVYLGTILSLSIVVVVLENQSFKASFKRSKNLVTGNFWKVFLILAFTVILVIPSAILEVPEIGVGSKNILSLISLLYSVFYIGITSTIFVVLYYHLIRVEQISE